MGLDNPVHIVFVAAIALIVLGPKRLPEVTRALGRSVREFRDAINGQEHAPAARAPAEEQPPPPES
jgi:sec-independent protein translocase protein TatA